MRVICLAFLLAIAGGCDHGHKAKPVVAPAVPSALADGSNPARVPVALRRFSGHRVLGARELTARTNPVRPSCLDAYTRARARFSGAWLSTEGVTVEYSVSGHPRVALISCDEIRVGRRWVRCGGGVARSRDPGRIELAGGGLSVVCDDRAEKLAFMWIAVPAKTPWTLVDHGSFWVAYPTARRRLIRAGKAGISGRFRVAFVDDHGGLIRERAIRGVVAG